MFRKRGALRSKKKEKLQRHGTHVIVKTSEKTTVIYSDENSRTTFPVKAAYAKRYPMEVENHARLRREQIQGP